MQRLWTEPFKAHFIKSVEWGDEKLGVYLFMTLGYGGSISFEIGNHLKEFGVSMDNLLSITDEDCDRGDTMNHVLMFEDFELEDIKIWMYKHLERGSVRETIYQKLTRPELYDVRQK